MAARQPDSCPRRRKRRRSRAAPCAYAACIRRADRAARLLCGAAARLRQRAHAQGCAGISRGLSGRASARDGGACAARTGAAGSDSLRAGRHLCARRSCRARALHVAACARHGRVGSAHRAVRSRGTHPRARSGGRLPHDGRSHTHPLPADRGAACAAHGALGDRHCRGRARARAKRRGCAAARGLVFAARGARRTGKAPRRCVVHRRRHYGDAGFVAAAGLCDRERVGRGAAADPGVGGGQGSA